jgi:hypothetical protein
MRYEQDTAWMIYEQQISCQGNEAILRDMLFFFQKRTFFFFILKYLRIFLRLKASRYVLGLYIRKYFKRVEVQCYTCT